jgi:NAD(P)H-hydrate epimerase
LRSGCGLVALAIPESLVSGASVLVPEAIFIPLPEKNGHLYFRQMEKTLSPWLDRFDAMVLGPGLGRSPDSEASARFLYDAWKKPLLIDADALRVEYGTRRGDVVATPHSGEAAFILGTTPNEVEGKKLASCKSLTHRFGTVLLKGPHTLVSNGLETRIVLEGGPELATPGSGDVLSGIVGAFLASGMAPLDAATLGALVHGVSGASAELSGNPSGLLAREIAHSVRAAMTVR